MTMALGIKNKTAASTHKLIEDVPLCAAAAIQRGPRTVAMLKSRTSQKPISRRSNATGLTAELAAKCPVELAETFSGELKESRPGRGLVHPACGNCGGKDLRNFRMLTTNQIPWLCLLAGRPPCRPIFLRDAYRA